MSDVNTVQSFDYYIELYNDMIISVSATSNAYGSILLDDDNNPICSKFHSGSNYITSGVKTISSNIILYDDTDNFVYIDSNFDENDIDKHFLLKPTQNLKYKIGVDKVLNATVSGDVLLTDLTNKIPFKVFLNGRIMIEDDEYTYDSSGITILSPFNSNISLISNDIIIYTYTSNQTITSGSLTLTYESPKSLVPTFADILDKSYFDTYTSTICTFDGFSVDQGKSNNVINNTYQYISKDKEVNRNSKISITMYDFLQQVNVRTLIGNQVKFRILAFNADENKLTIYSNCIWKNSLSSDISRTRTNRNFNIDFEDEIAIAYLGDNTVYGYSTYGSGVYGGINYTVENFEVN